MTVTRRLVEFQLPLACRRVVCIVLMCVAIAGLLAACDDEPVPTATTQPANTPTPVATSNRDILPHAHPDTNCDGHSHTDARTHCHADARTHCHADARTHCHADARTHCHADATHFHPDFR